LGAAYAAAACARQVLARPTRVERPVICVGNINVGGAGKTPIVLALAKALGARGVKPHLLTRGYGGSEAGPLRVDPSRHGFAQVGDEALLLADAAPTWVSHDRVQGARAAIAADADLIIMDDGLQNPGLAKDVSLVAVDGEYGFGNGQVLPAGPLREPLSAGLARVQAAVLIGEDRHGLGAELARRVPVIEARLEPEPAARAAFAGKRVVAFAGIGRPEKFFATLEGLGAILVDRVPFADHHAFRPEEIERLRADAARENAVLVTTAKDAARLPRAMRDRVEILRVDLVWRDLAKLEALLVPILRR
jgi:tetraacyldisaccharide 4'-kinase